MIGRVNVAGVSNEAELYLAPGGPLFHSRRESASHGKARCRSFAAFWSHLGADVRACVPGRVRARIDAERIISSRLCSLRAFLCSGSVARHCRCESLADMGNSFRFVSDTGFTPFNRRAVSLLAAAAVLPCLALLLLVMPFSEILNALAKMAL